MADISKTKAALYARLGQRKMRRRLGLFTAEGTKCVADTLGKFELEALVATPRWLEEHPSLAAVASERVMEASAAELTRISTLSTASEVIAVYSAPAEPEFPTELLPRGFYLVLDGVQDPGNLGTIVRTAHWFGVDTIFASRDSADIYGPKAIQSTMGSVASVRVIYCDVAELLERQSHLPVYGLLLGGENIFAQPEGFEPGFIVMGNEGNGISERVRRLIDRPLTIPPANPESHPDSLNVAVATAVTLATMLKN